MDETPTWFDAPIKNTVDKRGTKQVPIKTLNGEQRKRITTILTVTKSGRLLPPCIVEKSQSRLAKERAGDTLYERWNNGIQTAK